MLFRKIEYPFLANWYLFCNFYDLFIGWKCFVSYEEKKTLKISFNFINLILLFSLYNIFAIMLTLFYKKFKLTFWVE